VSCARNAHVYAGRAGGAAAYTGGHAGWTDVKRHGTVRVDAERTGHAAGFEPAGGIRTAKDALAWMILMREELGRRWLETDLSRFGSSGLLGNLERQLEHHVAGRYAARHEEPLA